MLNQLILGDNLEILKGLPDESVDLCYIDPPFFSNRNYAVIWGDKGEIRSFEDCWEGGIDTYINWMYRRVEQIHRILKPTGSFYLHCDWHADAYLRVYVLDKIFGVKNLRGGIVWKRTNAHNDAKKKLAVLTDTIWYYSKQEDFTYNPVYKSLNEKYLKDFYKYEDKKGVYQLDNLANPSKLNPNGLYEYKGYLPPANGWRCSLETMKKWDAEGLIYFPESKEQRLRKKRYLETSKGILCGNLWDDIQNVQSAKERIGYPTQKPEALLERIIKASSNEGDLVMDCFTGGGTTIAVAQKLGRNWIGIDQSASAFGVTRERILGMSKPLFPIKFETKSAKWDYDNLRKMDDFEFEKLCVKTLGGQTTKAKKGGDLGKDGILNNWSVISVKRSTNVGRNVADNLRSAVLRFRRGKNIKKQQETLEFTLQHDQKINLAEYDGLIVAFSFSRGLKAELAQLEREGAFKILALEVEEILPVAKRPKVKLEIQCKILDERTGDYKFTATATTDDNRLIEFYAFKIWQKVEKEYQVLEINNFNKTGVYERELKYGEYKIVATATDEYGLTGQDQSELFVGEEK